MSLFIDWAAVYTAYIVLRFHCRCEGKILYYPDGNESVGCFVLTVFLMSCSRQCSVAHPHGAVGWSAVCDCGIS